MFDYDYLHLLGVCICIILVAFILTELLDRSQLFAGADQATPILQYDYAGDNGPHTWKKLFKKGEGNCQSPVNIVTQHVIIVDAQLKLEWSNYSCQPKAMKLYNDGCKVCLLPFWYNDIKPHLSGGPLHFVYEFHNLQFHWGPSDAEGSEHTIDYVRFPMELQMLHCKRGFATPTKVAKGGDKAEMLIVSYFFEITAVDNPYLDQIVNHLWMVTCPGSCTQIPPFPLDWFYPPFCRNYYQYMGSLTQPPCSEVVTWIIQPDPIGISSNQVAQFRKIRNTNGPILSNTRPVQCMNCREVFFNA